MASPVMLGLDFGGSKIGVAVADAGGGLLGRLIVPVDPQVSAEQTFAHGIAAAHRLLGQVAAGRLLASVGACTFGIPHDDRVELAPNIAGWERLAFGATLRLAFPGARIRTATDVKAAARAEAESGALAGCNPGVYVNLGTGFAVAIVVDGVVVNGRHDASGEIGYNQRAAGDPARAEDVVSGKALDAVAARLLGRPDAGALFGLADTDPAAAQACDQFISELCFHLTNLTIAVDPHRVVVGGGIVRSWDRLQPAIAGALASAVPFPPELVIAAHPYDAPLRGALALARSAAPDPSRSADVLEGAPS